MVSLEVRRLALAAPVEPGIEDVLNGRDPALGRTVDVLRGMIGKAGKLPLG